MANFPTHWRLGLATSTCGSLVLHWIHLVEAREMPIVILVGLVASIIPDIDSDTSKPLRIIFNGLALILPPILIWRIPWIHTSGERVLLFWFMSIFVILKPMHWLFKKCTVHRGIIHSIPAAITFGCLAFILAYHESSHQHLQLSIGLLACLGYLTHLVLDEIWAVDFNGKAIKVKKSFGSALSLTGRSQFQTMWMYLCVMISSYYAYCLHNDVPFLSDDSYEYLMSFYTWIYEVYADL